MESNPLGITQLTTSNNPMIQKGREELSSALDGFSRLFSKIQQKIDPESGNENKDLTEQAGKALPESGKNVPLQFSSTLPVDEKPATAVLSTHGERLNSPLAKQDDIDIEEIISNEIIIAPLGNKIEVSPKSISENSSAMPKINLPTLDNPQTVRETPLELPEIAAANKIVAYSGISEVANTDKIVTNPENLKTENSQLASKQTEQVLPFSIKPATTLEQASKVSVATDSAQKVSPAQISPTQKPDPIIVNTQIEDSNENLAGISALTRELGFGQYQTEQALATNNKQKPVQQTALNTATPVADRIEIAQLDTKAINTQVERHSERPLVEAAFQRQAVDTKSTEVKPLASDQFLNKPVSELAQNHPAKEVPAVNIQEQAQQKLQAEANILKSIQDQSFEDLWNKANSVEDSVNKIRMEQLMGSRPVSELSRNHLDSILPAGTINAPSTTKPSGAIQPLFSVSSTATGMPNPSLNIRQNGWENSLAQNVSWMTANNVKTLQVHISPAELGPIHIHASMEQDKLMLQINAQHGMTREALEAAAPKLRDMIAENNFSSVDVDVSNDGFAQRQYSENDDSKGFNGESESDIASLAAGAAGSNQSAAKLGLVDTFA